MDFWAAVVIIVVVGSLSGTVTQYFKRKEHSTESAKKMVQEIQVQLAKQNERILNLETVILDLENEKKYQNL